MTRAHRKLMSWIAMLALLAAASMPSLMHPLGEAARAGLIELCTATGIKYVQADGAPPANGDARGKDCHYCPTPDRAADFLAPVTAPFVALSLPAFAPRLFYASPRPMPIWHAARARAPPVSA